MYGTKSEILLERILKNVGMLNISPILFTNNPYSTKTERLLYLIELNTRDMFKPPLGGATGEVLAKASTNDYDVEWTSIANILGYTPADDLNVVHKTGNESVAGIKTFSDNQIIDTSSTSAALRVTQRGTGDAIVVEDSTNPDTSPFVVASDGKVGIGTATPSYFLEALSSGGTDAVIVFDGGTAANANLVSRADTSIKTPSLVITDRTNAYSVATSFYIALDRSPSSLFANRNDVIYVNNYLNKGHYFVTNNGGVKSTKMIIDSAGSVGIGTTSPSSSALLELSSTSKGLLTPRVTTTERNAISTPATGLLVYDTTLNEFYYYSGIAWTSISGSTTTSGIPHGTATGTDTYAVTISGVTSYTDGDAYLIRFTNGNTTGCTLNVNSLGAIPLYRNNDGELIGGDIIAGGEMLCVYNSTTSRFQVIGTAPNTLLAYVTNAETTTITKGQPVYAFGGTGDRLKVKLAYNTGDSTSAQTVGLVLSSSIAANQKGLIIVNGQLDGLNILPTATWSDGDPVYLGATAGTITKTKPHAPNHLVYLGFVTTASNGSAGRLYVRVQNGYELDELHNVQAQTPSLNDTLYYDNTVSPAQWKTASIATILGYTPGSGTVTSIATTSPILGGTITTSGTISIQQSDTSKDGYLSSTDWNTFNNKQAAITGAATTITSSNLTASRAVISNSSGKIDASSVTDTELGYVSGVTSNIQTQLNSKIASSVSFISAALAQALTGGASPVTRYHAVAGTISSLTTAYQIPIPTACTFSNFYFRIYSAQGATGSLVATLQKNAVDTALTITIAAGSAAGNFSDTTNTVTFAAGDTWQIKTVQNATSGSTSAAGYSFKLSGL